MLRRRINQHPTTMLLFVGSHCHHCLNMFIACCLSGLASPDQPCWPVKGEERNPCETASGIPRQRHIKYHAVIFARALYCCTAACFWYIYPRQKQATTAACFISYSHRKSIIFPPRPRVCSVSYKNVLCCCTVVELLLWGCAP